MSTEIPAPPRLPLRFRLLVSGAYAVLHLALIAVLLWLLTYHHIGGWGLFLLLPLAMVPAAATVFLGRPGRLTLLGVMTGFLVVTVLPFFAGPQLIQSWVLHDRGVATTAVVGGAAPAGLVNEGFSGMAEQNKVPIPGAAITTTAGRPLPGVLDSSDVRLGQRLTVVVDPRDEIDSRLPGDVRPGLDTELAAGGVLVLFWTWFVCCPIWPFGRRAPVAATGAGLAGPGVRLGR